MWAMVKSFEEYINEKFEKEIVSAEDCPECLLKIVNYINQRTFKSNKHNDGRVGSIKDEDDCISLLKESDDFIVSNEVIDNMEKDKTYIFVPKIREWYDLEVVYNNKHYYINIKSSNMKTYDNVGGVSAILFGLFGKRESLSSKKKSEQYSKLFYEYNKYESGGSKDLNNIDYYFLVINKQKLDGCFLTSLNHITKDSIRPNGSNLPFQCNWSKNSHKKILTKSQICNIIIDTVWESLVKSIDIFEQEPIKIFMKNHNKINNIPKLF